jgi:hypothetical protein
MDTTKAKPTNTAVLRPTVISYIDCGQKSIINKANGHCCGNKYIVKFLSISCISIYKATVFVFSRSILPCHLHAALLCPVYKPFVNCLQDNELILQFHFSRFGCKAYGDDRGEMAFKCDLKMVRTRSQCCSRELLVSRNGARNL